MAQQAVIRAHNRAQAKGSDPRVATCRGKLQNKRSKLNQEINKELRLRAGAENLFKATNNRKLKETVALELSFVNSNLQLLKEQLAELNSSVEIYQGESSEPVMPMIPLGLKETKEIDFAEPFKDFILEHYSEEGNKYSKAIADFMDVRQAMRSPHRDSSGVSLLFQYYNQLYFVERRFFPPDRSLPIYFEWFDSLTGVPSSQRTVAFEKACVLFNLAALYTQMGAKQHRGTAKGLDQAVDHFLRAAGSLGYLRDNFTNGPSIDLAQDMLNMLVHLMLAQARECLFEKLTLQSREKRDADIHFDLALEAQELAKRYDELAQLMGPVSDYLPYSWASLCTVKAQHYAALGHSSAAAGLKAASPGNARVEQLISLAPEALADVDPKQRYPVLRAAYLNRATACQEEAARLHRMCRELRAKTCLTRVLQANAVTTEKDKETVLRSAATLAELVETTKLPGKSKFCLRPTPPDFGQVPVTDLFQALGPLAVFSAKHRWSPPRTVQLHHQQRQGQTCVSSSCSYGFSITTDSPTVVTNVQQNSLAQIGGMKEGDFIVAIDDTDVKWASHDQIVNLIKAAKSKLTLKIVTPEKSKTRGKHDSAFKQICSSGALTALHHQSAKALNTKTPSPSSSEKKLWNPFKKTQLEKSTSLNVILR
ncbi:BRO1 [Nesidiocoris tenuis]|uniref:BRO1 n=1 Tax=Nesidiocoris tenuis TaxID=355587 RepID=A0ABN7B7V5_9HEMI|nr:BRO1 [Nesidiocoris tenuis]